MLFIEWFELYIGLFEDLRRAAITENDAEKVQELLSKNSYRLHKHKRACLITVLLLEVKNSGNKKIVHVIEDFLKSVKFDVDAINLKIYYAVLYGDEETVKSFLKTNVKSSTYNLHLLVNCLFYKKHNIHNRKEILLLLIQYGLINVYSKKFEHNLLHRLVLLVDKNEPSTIEIAEILIKHGSSIHLRDRFQSSPLDCSVLKQDIPLISFFLKKGADVNEQNNEGPPIYQAVKFCKNKDLIDFLLSKGADINRKNSDGETPLHEACERRNEELIRFLLRRGADISAIADVDNTTPLFVIQNFEPNDYLKAGDVIEGFYKCDFNYFTPATVDQNNRCLIVLVKEFSKLIFQKIPVLREDIMSMRKEAREHSVKCLAELKEMSETEFHAPYTFYSVLTESINVGKFSHLTSNEKLSIKFEESLKRFPYYQVDLKIIWDEAVEIKEKFEAEISKLYSVFNNNLPDIVIRKLAKNLLAEE